MSEVQGIDVDYGLKPSCEQKRMLPQAESFVPLKSGAMVGSGIASFSWLGWGLVLVKGT